MTVDDAHTVVANALTGTESFESGLHDLRLADLNETERSHAIDALDALHDLERALASRGDIDRIDIPWEISRGQCEEEADE